LSLKNIKIKSISAGYKHSGCISTNNSLFMFGNNQFGQCGIKNKYNIYFPTKININKNIKINKISLARWHSILLDNVGNMYSTGWTKFGALGLNRNIVYNKKFINEFKYINCKYKMSDVKCGAVHSASLSLDKKILYIWGRSKYGRLGFNNEYNDIYVPKIIMNWTNNENNIFIKEFSLGGDFTNIIMSNGIIYKWGKTLEGQLSIDKIKYNIIKPMKWNYNIKKYQPIYHANGDCHSLLLCKINF